MIMVMLMKAFRVTGSFMMGDAWQNFTKEVVGDDENAVREAVFSRLGSKHRVKRTRIKIAEVSEIALKDVTDPITRHILETAVKSRKKKG